MRKRIIVHGHVQGVYFRDSTRRLALRENVAGWVRNNYDGTVEAVFEGDPRSVERLVEFCRSGPRGAHVTSLDVHDEPAEGARGFEIR